MNDFNYPETLNNYMTPSIEVDQIKGVINLYEHISILVGLTQPAYCS